MHRRTFVVGGIAAAGAIVAPGFTLAQTSSGSGTPSALAKENPFVSGNGLGVIPAGTTDGVEIVAQGPIITLSVPVVIRNNTADVVAISKVIGTARDAAGTLLDEAALSDVAPRHVQPNGVAFGMAVFSEMDIPEDATIELEVEYGQDSTGPFQYIDLPITEIEQTSTGFVGTLKNTTDQDLELIGVVGVTLSDTGQPIGHVNGYATDSVVPAGGTGAFEGYTSGDASPTYLVAAYGIA